MATTPGPKTPVGAPAPLLPSRSLLQALGTLDSPLGWEAGVIHVQGRAVGAGLLDWCSPGSIGAVAEHCCVGSETAFIVWAPELRGSQSLMDGRTLLERQDSARLNLERTQSFVIARELMYGAFSVAGAYGNPYLTDPANMDVITTAPQPYHVAFDRITDLWAETMLGERGILHVPPAVARVGIEEGFIVERGTQLVDAGLGNLVVTDAAYARAHPDGLAARDPLSQIQWIFMSPNIDVRLGDVVVLPADEAEMRQSVNRATNSLVVQAQRFASYTYEEHCASDATLQVLSIPVDLCNRDCIFGAS